MLLVKFNTPVSNYKTLTSSAEVRATFDMGELDDESIATLNAFKRKQDVNMILCDTDVFAEFLEFIYAKGYQTALSPEDRQTINSHVEIATEKRGSIPVEEIDD